MAINVPVTIVQQAVSIATGALIAFSPLSYGAKCNGVDDDLPGLQTAAQKCADAVAAGGRRVVLDLCGKTYYVSETWRPAGRLAHVTTVNGMVVPLGTELAWVETDQAVIDYLRGIETLTADGKPDLVIQKPLVQLAFALNCSFDGVDLDGKRIAAGPHVLAGKPNNRWWRNSYWINLRTYSLLQRGSLNLHNVWAKVDDTANGQRDSYGLIYNATDNMWSFPKCHHCHCPVVIDGATLNIVGPDFYNGYQDDDQPANNPRLLEYRGNTCTISGGRLGNGVRHIWNPDLIIHGTKFGYTGGVNADAVFVFYATRPDETLDNFGLQVSEVPIEIKNGTAKWAKFLVEPAADGDPANSWAMTVDQGLSTIQNYAVFNPGPVNEVGPSDSPRFRRYVNGADYGGIEFQTNGVGNRRPSYGAKGSKIVIGSNCDDPLLTMDVDADNPSLDPARSNRQDLGTDTLYFREGHVKHVYLPAGGSVADAREGQAAVCFDGYAVYAVFPDGTQVALARVGYPPEDTPPPPPPPVIDQLVAEVMAVAAAENANVWAIIPSLSGSWQDAGVTPALLAQPLGRQDNLRLLGPASTQTTGAARPSLAALPNGNPAANFSANTLYMTTPDGSGTSGHLIVACITNLVESVAGLMGNRSTASGGNPGVALRAGDLGGGPGYQLFIGNNANSSTADKLMALSVPAVVSGSWTPTSMQLRVNGGTPTVTAHTRDVTQATPMAVGRHRQSAAAAGAQGPMALWCQSQAPLSTEGAKWVERLGAYLIGATLAYDQAPVLADFNAYKITNYKWVGIPYSDKTWVEPSTSGTCVMDVYLPTLAAPPGGRKVVIYAHPNGENRTITDGSDRAIYIRDPLLAANIAVISIEFPHPVVNQAALGAGYLDAYNDIGRAIQKVRSMADAFGFDTTKIGVTCRSRGSLSLFAALLPDRKRSAGVGSHADQQSSVPQAIWICKGQSVHRQLTGANEFIIPEERAAHLLAYPDNPDLLDAANLVPTAPQHPYLHLSCDSPYWGVLKPRATLEADMEHYPDMMLLLKQRYIAKGLSGKVEDTPNVGSVGGADYDGHVAWFASKLA